MKIGKKGEKERTTYLAALVPPWFVFLWRQQTRRRSTGFHPHFFFLFLSLSPDYNLFFLGSLPFWGVSFIFFSSFLISAKIFTIFYRFFMIFTYFSKCFSPSGTFLYFSFVCFLICSLFFSYSFYLFYYYYFLSLSPDFDLFFSGFATVSRGSFYFLSCFLVSDSFSFFFSLFSHFFLDFSPYWNFLLIFFRLFSSLVFSFLTAL